MFGRTIPKRIRAQSAMEYLMTYGWAILIIAVVLGALFQLGVFNANNFAPKAPPGSCQVFRPNGPGTTSFINLEGECQGELPQYVAQFNGQSSYILVPTSSLYQPANAYTVSYWLYVSPSFVGTGCVFDDNWMSAGQEQFFVGGTTFYEKVGTTSVQLTSTIQFGSYVFVVGTGSPSGENLYFNGQSVNSISTAPTLAATSIPLSIGACNGGSEDYFDGQIANVQIYNISLSQPEIQALYQEGIGGAPIDLQNLVGWWPLNGNANDYSGNGNNGVPSGVTYTSNWYSGYTPP